MQESLADTARRVADAFIKFGISLHPQSRIAQVVAVLAPGRFVPATDSLFPAALEGFRDIQVLGFVLSQLGRTADPGLIGRKLSRIAKDNLLPQNDMTESPGRDTQMELYVAAIANKGGMKPTFGEPALGEPDILCKVGGERFGIEVKRIKKEDRLEEHFRKAVSQIEKAKLPGVIVADMSLAFNRSNTPLRSNATIREFQEMHRRQMEFFVTKYYDRMKEWARGREVRGLTILDCPLREEPGKGWYLESFYDHIDFNPSNARRHREWEKFCKAFNSGYPTAAIEAR
jgi:hypothetical protein